MQHFAALLFIAGLLCGVAGVYILCGAGYALVATGLSLIVLAFLAATGANRAI